jgi:hypothetical protein
MQAQGDLDELLNSALTFAQRQLALVGEFFPFAATITVERDTEFIAVELETEDDRPASADVISACIKALQSQRSRLRAAAVVADVRLKDANQDAIRVSLEHADGQALRVILQYRMQRITDGIDYGEPQASIASGHIWI